jgi:feruloyl esterase
MLWGALAVTGAMRSQQIGAAPNCAHLARPGLFPDTVVVQTAAEVAADAKTGMPAYCEVTALITPVADSKIAAVYRLPENWNGRMLGLGGGGWAGNLFLSLPISGPGRAASVGLPRGYATAQTDGGHASPITTDVSWPATTRRRSPISVTAPFTR